MKKQLLLVGIMTAASAGAFAQNEYVKQYFYTSGGDYSAADNKVKIAVIKDGRNQDIDAVKGTYSNHTDIFFDKSLGRYIGTAHVGRSNGTDVVIRYDMDTYERLDSIHIPGLKVIARNDDKLVVAKYFGYTGMFVDIYNAITLQKIAEVEGISNYCSDVKIWGDSAFVSHNIYNKNYSDSLGFLSIIKISSGLLVNTVSLGEAGAGIDNLIIRKEMDNRLHIYFSNNGTAILSEVENMVLHAIENSTTVEVDEENIYYAENVKSKVRFSRKTKATNYIDSISSSVPAGFSNRYFFDRVNEQFITFTDDYVSPVKMYLNSLTEESALDTIELGLATTELTIDYRPGLPTAIAKGNTDLDGKTVYPNPFKDHFTIDNKEFTSWQLVNNEGKVEASGNLSFGKEEVFTENVTSGLYYLILNGNYGSKSFKLIRQ